ncbi:pentatricopeptide repeat-containing protein At1g11290, chloroplastic [Phragmites australis]|uniref:pentatricopeptide repeat-containing protein At1g11290, chloroplastic n=1 Tax=Phragmites australis TaxID=29695 RepID=UPI002D775EDD|nr:pentatricopeptide repeat-containing protein At1g11290, chloroplastic [Phragmites australis]XP_062227856.1 pentatricopeptide repeat-containing protein At1g11290, chloroplastic [Phragmites australis]XP_062227857.1 pentatricopeptide repeat-containing protein At1g11290, chloroplastic [Phragmites australis]XP_062227858.1 pentatricopeptide repeat-containing protein At1g11290, chloroplastic [Phragmites australis]
MLCALATASPPAKPNPSHAAAADHHARLRAAAARSDLPGELAAFAAMSSSSSAPAGARPVLRTFTALLKLCAARADLATGRAVHAQLATRGLASESLAATALANMYAKCRRPADARRVFDRMPTRDRVAWNALVAGYARNGLAQAAMEMVVRMQVEDGERPDSVTLVSVLPACADARALDACREVHAFALRGGFDVLVNVSTAILDAYCKCGAIEVARAVFDWMPHKNSVSWNAMINGYADNGNSAEALSLFKRMLGEGVDVTDVSVLAALQACGELGYLDEARRVHELLVRIGLKSNVSVMNALITMYSKCKRTDLAAQVFNELGNKTRISWNAMILGFTQNGCSEDAVRLFSRMQLENVKPDSFTLVSVIPAVADISDPLQARWIHGYSIRQHLDQDVYVLTALIDMYAKCGRVTIARSLFNSARERHVITWNAMIHGYGSHGFGKVAVELFEEMKGTGRLPNETTFLSVLTACSHGGLVDEGRNFFASMKEDYGLEPGMEHYGTMVDLLGRAGKLDEAWSFIQNMPTEPGISVYGAMLGACKLHKNVELAEKSARRIFELGPEEGVYHVLLANIYANASMWKGVARVRTAMEKKGLQKTPGWSIIQLKNEVHTFYSGSTNHQQAKEIYARLAKLIEEIKAVGYLPDTDSIHDVEDDVKAQLLHTHSEKLAIAYGLIRTAPGTTIQIKKNLRVCNDCHNATKLISLVTGREIIMRDIQRFHHFKHGKCSCGDYW